MAAVATAAMVASRVLAPRMRATQQAWHAWNALLGIIGLVTVPQVLAGTFFGIDNLWPAYVSAAPGATSAQVVTHAIDTMDAATLTIPAVSSPAFQRGSQFISDD